MNDYAPEGPNHTPERKIERQAKISVDLDNAVAASMELPPAATFSVRPTKTKADSLSKDIGYADQ